jgi:diacylglycerol kinase family enzyme
MRGLVIYNPAAGRGRTAPLRHDAQARLGASWEIACDPPQPLTIDGDVSGSTPASVDVRPAALPVIVPRPAPDC